MILNPNPFWAQIPHISIILNNKLYITDIVKYHTKHYIDEVVSCADVRMYE